LNDHTINHIALGYNSESNFNGQPSGDVTPWLPSALGINGTPNLKIPQIAMSSFSPPAGHPASGKAKLLSPFGSWEAGSDFGASESYIAADTLSHIRGKHNYKFGVEFRRYRDNDRAAEGVSFSFSYLQTALPGAYRKKTGNPFASFILGAADGGSRDVNTTTVGYRQGLFSLYAQDDWKVTPKLTASYGLRWEMPLKRREAFNRFSGLDPTMPNPGADGYPGALVFLGKCSVCTGTDSFQKMYYRQFAPRLGLAYAATSKLTVRGGYGISYAPPIANGWPGASAGYNSAVPFGSTSLYPRQFQNPADPAIFWSQLTNSALMPSWYTSNGRIGVPHFSGTLPDYAPDGMNYQTIEYTSPSLAQPYVQNWNSGFQYMLPAEVLVEIDYVGAKGTRLPAADISAHMNNVPTKYMGISTLGDYLGWDIDDALADPTASAALAQFGVTKKPFPSFSGTVSDSLRPYPQFTGIANDTPYFGSSTYHSLQATVHKRVAHGLNFLAAYTWSKTLSNEDATLQYYSGTYFQDYYNQKNEKALASFDYRHNLKLTWVYDLPVGKGRRWLSRGGPLDKVVGGWRVTAIHHYSSGDVLEIYNDGVDSGMGSWGVRGDVIPGQAQKVSFKGTIDSINGTQYLNPAAFGSPPVDPISGSFAQRWGTAPRYLPHTRGPGIQTEDAGIMKDIAITERYVLRFRAEAENLLNRTGMADPNTDVADMSSFGRIYGVAQGPRQIQLSLRLDF
jgi:hypothetical protein